MRNPAAILILCLTGCLAVRSEPAAPRTPRPAEHDGAAGLDSAVRFLLDSAATDFHLHGPAGPLRFREVRIGHVIAPNGQAQYRMCGEFLETRRGSSGEWVPFATIRTSGYEQWIGGQAALYCGGVGFSSDAAGDLSSALQTRFDSIE